MRIENLSPEALDKLAHDLAPNTEDRRWAMLAAVLGRIEDGKLYYGYGYGSTVKYAEDELHLSVGTCTTLLGLWRMIRASTIPVTRWAELPITYAQQLRRILALGGDPDSWFERASAVTSASELRTMIDRLATKETFVTFKAAVPVALLDLLHEQLRRALPEATDRADNDPSLIHHRSTRFRCLEVIVRHFALTYEPGADVG